MRACSGRRCDRTRRGRAGDRQVGDLAAAGAHVAGVHPLLAGGRRLKLHPRAVQVAPDQAELVARSQPPDNGVAGAGAVAHVQETGVDHRRQVRIAGQQRRGRRLAGGRADRQAVAVPVDRQVGGVHPLHTTGGDLHPRAGGIAPDQRQGLPARKPLVHRVIHAGAGARVEIVRPGHDGRQVRRSAAGRIANSRAHRQAQQTAGSRHVVGVDPLRAGRLKLHPACGRVAPDQRDHVAVSQPPHNRVTDAGAGAHVEVKGIDDRADHRAALRLDRPDRQHGQQHGCDKRHPQGFHQSGPSMNFHLLTPPQSESCSRSCAYHKAFCVCTPDSRPAESRRFTFSGGSTAVSGTCGGISVRGDASYNEQ